MPPTPLPFESVYLHNAPLQKHHVYHKDQGGVKGHDVHEAFGHRGRVCLLFYADATPLPPTPTGPRRWRTTRSNRPLKGQETQRWA